MLSNMNEHIFKYTTVLSCLLRITLPKYILYVLIGPLLSMALVPYYGGSNYGGLAMADSSLSESVTEAQCRGSCLGKYTQESGSRDDACQKIADCYMCWSICHLLQGESTAGSSLCSDRAACYPGCQTACRFYEFLPPKNLTPPLLHDLPPMPALMSPPRLTLEGQLVWDTPKWPAGVSSEREEEIVMYIIMTNMGGQWHQHIQTSSNSVNISKKLRNSGIRVLAVTSSGLAAYSENLHWDDTDYVTHNSRQESGVTTESTTPSSFELKTQFVEENGVPSVENHSDTFSGTKDVFQDPDSSDKKYSYDYVLEDSNSQPPSVTVDHSWMVNLTLKSVGLLASVEVIWDIRGSGPVDYLVTWTEATGGISGHLVSQQNVADISLWKGQQYAIQVELLDQYGNSVLRSIPRSISFSSKNAAPTIKREPPDPILRRKPSISPTTVRSSFTDSYMISRRVKEDFGVTKEEEDEKSQGLPGFDWRSDHDQEPRDESPDWGTGGEPFPNSFGRSNDSSPSYADGSYQEDVTSRYWNDIAKKIGNNPGGSRDSFVNSQKIKNSDEENDEAQSSSLLVWAACLGVGAVIILILIVLAIRTLKRTNSTKRQEICRTEDYLSETTASSVNSSSITTTSQLTRSQCSRPEEEQWTYESVYGVTASNQPSTQIMLHRHPPPPPPIPLSSPPHTPIHLNQLPPITSHYHHNHHHHHHPFHHSHHSMQSGGAASIAPGRIDNASMIENYILSLDPSPVVKQVAY